MTRQQFTDEDDAITAFWNEHPELTAKEKQRAYDGYKLHVDTRCTFVDWVDSCARDGRMSEDMAQDITLGAP